MASSTWPSSSRSSRRRRRTRLAFISESRPQFALVIRLLLRGIKLGGITFQRRRGAGLGCGKTESISCCTESSREHSVGCCMASGLVTYRAGPAPAGECSRPGEGLPLSLEARTTEGDKITRDSRAGVKEPTRVVVAGVGLVAGTRSSRTGLVTAEGGTRRSAWVGEPGHTREPPRGSVGRQGMARRRKTRPHWLRAPSLVLRQANGRRGPHQKAPDPFQRATGSLHLS